MNKFDEFIRSKARNDNSDIPTEVSLKLKKTLEELPEAAESKRKLRLAPKIAATAAVFVFISLVVMPNVSSVYAETMGEIPVIGNIIRVVTVRNYAYSDERRKMDINVPEVDGSSEAAEYINKSVDELTEMLSDRFYEELEEYGDEGYGTVSVNYEVVTDTEDWFTLKIEVFEAAGSSNTYYKYYHIDKKSGKTVTLSDMAENDGLYSVLEENIKEQMREQISADPDLIYWVDSSPFGDEIVTLDGSHNFYLNENGDIVIVFDKYEVAPGSMGTPEFMVSKSLVNDYLKEEYRK